jgi:hypothetical protein
VGPGSGGRVEQLRVDVDAVLWAGEELRAAACRDAATRMRNGFVVVGMLACTMA